jgi:hypothetical protein
MNETNQNIQTRTLAQNRAIHKLFGIMSDELNTLGLDMRVVLKPTYQIWWTPEMVKEHLWKPLQEVMYQKKSTTELTTAEVSKVYEQMAHIIGEKFGVEISFPSQEETENYIKSYDNI